MRPECHGRPMLFLGVFGTTKAMKYECITCNTVEWVDR